MARAEIKIQVPEPTYDPVVVHHKATELIHQPNEGFNAILHKIPAVEEATGALFWDMGRKIRIRLDSSTELDLNWEPGAIGQRTVLDVGLNRTDGFKLAFITVVHPSPGTETTERSSFLSAEFQEGSTVEPPIENTPTAFERIEELKESLKGFIPLKE